MQILRILKMIATNGFPTALKCTKFAFAPDPAGGAYSAPRPPSCFTRPCFQGERREGDVEGWKETEKRRKKEGIRREGK